MTKQTYYKQTNAGLFVIKAEPSGRWSLSIQSDGDTEYLGSYHSPESAADDVYTQHTGCDDWDNPIRNHAPRDLSEWETIAR